MTTKQKLTVYVPDDIFEEMRAEAERQDRTVSWMIETCWKLSKGRLQRLTSVTELYEENA